MSTSRVFSSAYVSSSHRARNLQDPLIFNEDYGLVTSWYNVHRGNGSTTIQKMQLRKEHAAPAYHEYILLLTRAGNTYRVDRGRDGPVLDAMRDQGVPPFDTIAMLQLTSWEELDRTSYCVIGLRWEGAKTIDLKLVLDICFQIHNKSGKRYKLLTHNCYFFAQTIIMIAVRKTVACRTKLDKALKRGMRGITWKRCWEAIVGEQGFHRLHSITSLGAAVGAALGQQMSEQLGMELEQQLGKELGKELGYQLGKHLGLQLGRELERQLGPGLRRELEWELEQQKERELEEWRDLEQEEEEVRKWELMWQSRGNMEKDPEGIGCLNWWRGRRKWKQLQEEQREMEQKREKFRARLHYRLQQAEKQREQERRQKWEKERLRLWSQLQERLWKLEPELELELELAQGALLKILDIALNGELKLGWHRMHSKLNALATQTGANKLANMWAKWLIDNLGKVVMLQMKEASFLDCSFSEHVEFPPGFSASCAQKIQSRISNVPIETYTELEQYMIAIIEHHVELVPPALGPREQLKAEILNGMTATWHHVSPQFQRNWT